MKENKSYFNKSNKKFNTSFEEQDKALQGNIFLFCQKYKVQLIEKDLATEDGETYELFYRFSDDYGSYNIRGINKSIIEYLN